MRLNMDRTTDLALDPNLREYATDRQWEVLETWARTGSAVRAASALGISRRNVLKTKAVVLACAARHGYILPEASEFHMKSKVPEGFILRGQSAYVDKNGELVNRWDKTKLSGQDSEDARQLPDPKKVTKLSTMTDAEGKVIVQWTAERPEDVTRERAWRAFAEELSRDIPRAKPIPAPKLTKNSLLAGIPVGDHHFGMLSWHEETGDDYDLGIGEDLLQGAVNYLLNATGPADQALIAFLGDFLHYDSFETVTPTAGNHLDSDSRFSKIVPTAVRTMRYIIDLALRKYGKVQVIVEPGNHDLSASVFLALCLHIAYENEPRVTVDQSPSHFHYHRFGSVLIGTHHGHGTKMQNLPLIMATDRASDWGETTHRHIWTGHIHTSKVQPATSAQDYSGCVVESFRILPPPDAWAHQKGYRPHRDMKAIVYHEEYGEVARHSVSPAMLKSTQ